MNTSNYIDMLLNKKIAYDSEFPKMIWMSENVYFSIAIIVKNEEEYSIVIDNIFYLISKN